MRFNYLHILAAAIMALLPAGAALAADATPAAAAATATTPAIGATAETATTPAPAPETAATPAIDVTPEAAATPATASTATATPATAPAQCNFVGCDPIHELILRAGAWGVNASGSPQKVGEYQSLNSSPFWDADGLFSDGSRTLDITATGTDDEDTQVHAHFYAGPGLTANVDYQRFPHQLETTKTYPGFVTPAEASSANYYAYTNMNPGQDYAINVEELKANFKGNLTDDGMFKWRLEVFGIDKEGDRQANALAHGINCGAPTAQCHVTSQSQHIDWNTTQLEPAIEARLAPGLTVEYSRTMRTFTQDDQMITNQYANSSSLGFPLNGGVAGYAVVPDSTEQIDRLKVHAQLGDATDAYVLSYVGDDDDELNLTNRHLGGVDARITNHAIDGWKVTGYGKVYSENTQIQTQSLNALYGTTLANFYQDPNSALAGLAMPIDRDETATGVDVRWTPFPDEHGTVRSGLAFIGGYEYAQTRRTYDYDTIFISSTASGGEIFQQPDTDVNTFTAGVEEKWSPCFNSYVRCKFIDTAYPLYGISPGRSLTTPTEQESLAAALDSTLPTRETRIEVGSTWSPGYGFMLNGTFYVEDASNHGPYAYFDSTSYPFIISSWYAVTPAWTINAGYANFVNAINQQVSLGLTTPPAPNSAYTAPWRDLGSANVFNVGTSYAWSKQLKFVANFEYVRGLDAITSTPTPTAIPTATSYADLGGFSTVSNTTCQVSAGVDYLWRPRIMYYFRYNYYDFGDLATGLTSGKVNMFLGGMSAYF